MELIPTSSPTPFYSVHLHILPFTTFCSAGTCPEDLFGSVSPARVAPHSIRHFTPRNWVSQTTLCPVGAHLESTLDFSPQPWHSIQMARHTMPNTRTLRRPANLPPAAMRVMPPRVIPCQISTYLVGCPVTMLGMTLGSSTLPTLRI